ncbi:MAG TPA: hypothetical protein VHV99_17240, partial [Paraburkholderia sp.]|nr:hypothetical protein [Paraburkholderia sp.]
EPYFAGSVPFGGVWDVSFDNQRVDADSRGSGVHGRMTNMFRETFHGTFQLRAERRSVHFHVIPCEF